MTKAMTEEQLAEVMGKSGSRYRCHCGVTSPYVTVRRLADMPGWGVRFDVVWRLVQEGKTERSARVVSTTVEIFLCPKCNKRSKP